MTIQRYKHEPYTLWLNLDHPLVTSSTPDQTRDTIIQLLNDTSPPDRLVKNDTRTRIEKRTANQTPFAVKHFRTPAYKDFLYNIVKRTPAWREFQGALKLQRANIAALQPLALVRGSNNQTTETLITPWTSDPTIKLFLLDIPNTPSPQQTAQLFTLAKQLGQQLGQMLAANIINRDHKASNIIINPTTFTPTLIDPAGLRRFRNLTQLHRLLALLEKTTFQVTPTTTPQTTTTQQPTLPLYTTLSPFTTLRQRVTFLRAIQQQNPHSNILPQGAPARRALITAASKLLPNA